ncbi:MAG: hypothetical protein D6795_06990, partial [Deltaproteobacteria bacterium]
MSRVVPSGHLPFAADIVMDRTLLRVGLWFPGIFLFLFFQLDCAASRAFRVAVEDEGGQAVVDAAVTLHPSAGEEGIVRSTNHWGEADFRLPKETPSVEVSVAKA